MKRAHLLAGLLVMSSLMLCSCSDNKPTEPTPTADSHALFVEVNGHGNGSADSPFGSIQDAFDAASADSTVERIYIACGSYYESVVAMSGVSVYGGRNPQESWNLSSSDSTVIMGETIDGHCIGLAIRGVSDSILLSHLTIVSRDAIDSGSSSYGIYCIDAANVEIRSCRIVAGNGASGNAGPMGLPGEDGESGDWGMFGRRPVAGGAGGLGGRCDGSMWGWEPGKDGQPGASYLDSPMGGAGGTGDDGNCGTPGAGQDGGNGSHGVDGYSASWELLLKPDGEWIIATADSGFDGNRGCYGSGGGGGGGVATTTGNRGCRHGSGGSGGGAGAGPGMGGHGGQPGGASIAILSIRSELSISKCTLLTVTGGRGGAGGAGGVGGRGGKGGPIDCFTCCGGAGGVGGDGGNGGHGGGGCGGSSIGLLKCESTVDFHDNNSLLIGPAGEGGMGGSSGASRGSDGISRDLLEVLIGSADR